MKTRLRRALAMIALIAFVVTMLPLSAFAEARTSFIRSRIDSRPARPDIGIEIVPPKTENPKRSAIWDGSIAAGFAGGSGTEDDPYLISNGSELAYLAQQVNSGNSYENVHFKLTNDIYLNDTTDWELWGKTGSASAGKADTRDEVIEPTKQNKGDKMDVPIAIPVRPAPKTELESDALSDALNAAGQSNTFVSTGSYPWRVDSTTYDGRTAAQSGNYNVSSSTSSFSTTVTLSAGDIVSFEYCVSSENNYDKFKFSVNDSVVLTKSGLVSWNSYSYQATADGEYTFLWSYTKDGSVNGNSDACWVDNVYIGAPLAVTGISLLMTVFRGRNQRFIIQCTLRWTIARYRPQCKFSSEVSRNCRCLFARQIFNIFGQRPIYISAMFVLGAIFHETGLVWAQPMADALSLLLAAGLYFRISSKAYIKWRRVAAIGIKAVLVHQRFMVSAFDPIAGVHHDEHAGGQAARGHEVCS